MVFVVSNVAMELYGHPVYIHLEEDSAAFCINFYFSFQELTDNKDLRAAFTYLFGDFGVFPSEAGFNLLALLHDHFYGG